MGRKKIGEEQDSSENRALVRIKEEDLTFINTPFAYARILGRTTNLQQSVLFRISEGLQQYVKTFLDQKKFVDSKDPNSLFKALDVPVPRFKLKISDLGMETYRSREIAQAANELSKLRIVGPNVKDDGTIDGYAMVSVFPTVIVPKYVVQKNGEEMVTGVGDTDVIELEVHKYVTDIVFNMHYGYVNHPLQIADITAQQYSSLLYIIIKKYLEDKRFTKHPLKKKNNIVTIPYKQLRADLGMIQANPETGEILTEELYPQYSRFDNKVLSRCREDLNYLAGKNLIDIFIEKYQPRRKSERSEPTHIDFVVSLTELANRKTRNERKKAIEKQKEDEIKAKLEAQLTLELDEEPADGGGAEQPKPLTNYEIYVKAVELVDSVYINWGVELGKYADYRDKVIASACSQHADTRSLILQVLEDMADCMNNGKQYNSTAIKDKMQSDPRLHCPFTKDELKSLKRAYEYNMSKNK